MKFENCYSLNWVFHSRCCISCEHVLQNCSVNKWCTAISYDIVHWRRGNLDSRDNCNKFRTSSAVFLGKTLQKAKTHFSPLSFLILNLISANDGSTWWIYKSQIFNRSPLMWIPSRCDTVSLIFALIMWDDKCERCRFTCRPQGLFHPEVAGIR